MSAIGALKNGGRYNAPNTFNPLYAANSRVTAFKEIQPLFDTDDGQLRDAPRNPELVLTLEVPLLYVLDLTDTALCADFVTFRPGTGPRNAFALYPQRPGKDDSDPEPRCCGLSD